MKSQVVGYIEDNFFIVTSENYKKMQAAFYGYVFTEEKILIRENPDNIDIDIYSPGIYVNIAIDNNTIVIKQDYYCGFGLYIYRYNDYWAVSNSLYMLINYLSTKSDLTINSDFFDLYMVKDVIPPSETETIIKEINELKQGEYISINKERCELNVIKSNIEKYSVDIFSREGFELIKKWRNRYINIIKSLLINDYIVTADLSGGFDTRACLCIYKELLDQKFNIAIHTSTDGLSCHPEDLQIATKIADIYNFKLNNLANVPSIKIDSIESLLMCFYPMFFSHDEMYYKGCIYKSPIFCISGAGGESMRGYWTGSYDDYISNIVNYNNILDLEFDSGAKRILSRMISSLKKDYHENIDEAQKIYIHTRIKNHFLRSGIESFLANKIYIMPLLDPILLKLDMTKSTTHDAKSFLAFLFERYLPEISNLGFEGKRYIEKNTLAYVKEYNKNLPIDENIDDKKCTIYIKNNSIDSSRFVDECNPRQYIFNMYRSELMKKFIANKYNYKLYRFAMQYYEKNSFVPDRFIIKLVSLFILNYILQGDSPFFRNNNKYFKKYCIYELINNISTARIDLINESASDSRIMPIYYDHKLMKLDSPKWFMSKLGQGIVLECKPYSSVFRFKTNLTGTLKVAFRAMDKKYNINKELQLKIDYHKILIKSLSKKVVLKEYENLYGLSHDNSFRISLPVDSNEELEIFINFSPYDYNINDFINIVTEAYQEFYLN